MSTIRPLATIAVLAVLGVYLAHQINQGPPVAANDEWSSLGADELDAPPAWNGGAPAQAAVESTSLEARTAPGWAESSPSPEAVEVESAPAFPALPDLPPVEEDQATPIDPPPVQGVPAGATLATQPAPTATNQELTLPASIPQANYNSTQPASEPAFPTAPPQGSIQGSVPSLGRSVNTAAPQAPATPQGAPGFAAAWEAVQGALQRDELTRAHRMLSQWRDDPNLSTDQRLQVDGLLGQLAGSVVYSADHRLEPAHVVSYGETLESIAEQYDVPWQLLAKINGVATPDAVQVGQTLKVVRGPFNAEVDLGQGEIVLLVDNAYAGRFPVRVEGQGPAAGAWRVGQKQPGAAPTTTPKFVLESPSGARVEMSAGAAPPAGATGRLAVASSDMADLFDILSVGSTVTVLR